MFRLAMRWLLSKQLARHLLQLARHLLQLARHLLQLARHLLQRQVVGCSEAADCPRTCQEGPCCRPEYASQHCWKERRGELYFAYLPSVSLKCTEWYLI